MEPTAMIPVQRISHATFETPDLPRLLDYYTHVVGLTPVESTGKRAVLKTRLGEEAIVLEHGTAARCAALAFQVSPNFDLRDAEQQLARHAIKSERRSNVTPAVSTIAAFADPNGTRIELYSDCKADNEPGRIDGVAPMKLGHVAHLVADAKKISEFYIGTLGFRVSDWIEDFFVFMRCGPDHHTVNFRTGPKIYMHHIAFELQDWAHVHVACEALGRHKRPILWGPMRHVVGHNIALYHRDPDDHIVEFFTEIDRMQSEELGYFEPRPWHEDRPQRPKIWEREGSRQVWGVPPAPDYLRSRPPGQGG
jgi:catechol-2,3-dioxygenase